MTYSIIGILALIILLISNRDVIWYGKELSRTQKAYRVFLFGVMAYYITDLLWGILDARGLVTLLFADTAVYFAAMAAAVMFWTQYVISYLEDGNRFEKILLYTGRVFFAFELTAVAVNFFYPILFSFETDGSYHAGPARYATLAIQILMFMMTSAYTLYVTSRSEGSRKLRHLTIGLFGIAMVALIALQIFFPLMPYYAMGYMLGTCVLHSFVVEDEKEEYRRELENAVKREQRQKQELVESREALRDALAAAENANHAKTAFLSNMSHEIRTPMNAIIGLNNIALNDPTVSDRVREYLEKTGASAQHLLGIINDILDMSRIESGRMTIRKEEFSFREALEQVNTMISGQCREKGLNYDCRINGRIDDYYIGDDTKLKQVWLNILGNAVKFTPEGGSVSFVIDEGIRYGGKATLHFTISDTGIGMSPEFLPHVFETFSQENAIASGKYGSTGLGMPITKSIVELMNGNIGVESAKGSGTTFKVSVTLGESGRKSGEEQAGGSGTQDHGQEPDLNGRRVLLAEDVYVNSEIMIMVLSMRGIEAELAENGRIAVEMFEASAPGYYDAILMDMQMPEMDGLEATRTIRAMNRPDAAAIPIIALTANAFDEDVQRSMQAGLNAHLSKPVEPEDLYDTLGRLIR